MFLRTPDFQLVEIATLLPTWQAISTSPETQLQWIPMDWQAWGMLWTRQSSAESTEHVDLQIAQAGSVPEQPQSDFGKTQLEVPCSLTKPGLENATEARSHGPFR